MGLTELPIKENQLVETPGLVDLQVNGFGGLDFNTPGISPELFQLSLEAMMSSGVSTFLPTIITGSEKNMKVLNVNLILRNLLTKVDFISLIVS